MSDVKQKSWYRADIDGLRAVAVIAVILFHAQVPGFTGGYIGVDVFFVISGFLITSIIARQLRQGTFSLLQFWERRIRRIVPVLTVVLLITALAGYWLILFPLDYLDFGQSLLAQAVFLSNIFFLRKSDYFAGPSEASPLLHTWTLAIEEQFYVIFPIILVLAWRLGRRAVLWIIGFLFLGSLVWSQYLVLNGSAAFSIPFLPSVWAAANNATAAFYLLPARAFELLIGALLALLAIRPSSQWLAEVSAVAGIGFIMWSIVSFTSDTVFPGVAALIPTLGTALLIFAHTGRVTIVSSVLSKSSVVWVGLLSYSLYLWHWPVFVFGKYWLGVELLSGVQIFGLLTLVMLLSVATYYAVEQPVRNWKPNAPPWQVFLVGFGAMGVLAAVGYFIISTNGLPQRAPEAAQQIALGATDFGPDRTRCFVESQACQFGNQTKPVTHVVLGDSHGGAIMPAISAATIESDTNLETYLSPGCSPFTALATQSPNSTCDQVHQKALTKISNGEITDVLLVSRWSDWRSLADTEHEAKELFAGHAQETVAEFDKQGVTVFILLQVPDHQYFEARAAFYAAVENNETPDYSLSRLEHDLGSRFVNDTFVVLAKLEGVHVLDPTPLFCNDTVCDLVRDTMLLYQDGNHINQSGARVLAPLIAEFTGANSAIE